MAKTELEIVLEVLNLASPELKALRGDLSDLQAGFGKLGEGSDSAGSALKGFEAQSMTAAEKAVFLEDSVGRLADKYPLLRDEMMDVKVWGDDLIELHLKEDSVLHDLGISVDEYRAALEKTKPPLEDATKANEGLWQSFKSGALDIRSVIRTLDTIGAILTVGKKAWKFYGDSIDVAVKKGVKGSIAYTRSTENITGAFDELKMSIGTRLIPKVALLKYHLDNLIPTFGNLSSEEQTLLEGMDRGIITALEYAAATNIWNTSAETTAAIAAYVTEQIERQDLAMAHSTTVADGWANSFGGVTEEGQKLIKSIQENAEAFEEAEEASIGFFDSINSGIGSTISGFINDINFMMAGGLEYQLLTEGISNALDMGAITPEQAKSMFSSLFIEEQALQIEINNITASQAAQNIKETLHLSLEESRNILGEVQSGLDLIDGTTLDIAIKVGPLAQQLPGELDMKLFGQSVGEPIEITLNPVLDTSAYSTAVGQMSSTWSGLEGEIDGFDATLAAANLDNTLGLSVFAISEDASSTLGSLEDIDGKKVFATITTYHIDIFEQEWAPNPQKPSSSWPGLGGRKAHGGDQDLDEQASGGALSDLSLVGEEGPELIINGIVIPAQETRKLMALGLLPKRRFAFGGPLDGGGGGSSLPAAPDFDPLNLDQRARLRAGFGRLPVHSSSSASASHSSSPNGDRPRNERQSEADVAFAIQAAIGTSVAAAIPEAAIAASQAAAAVAPSTLQSANQQLVRELGRDIQVSNDRLMGRVDRMILELRRMKIYFRDAVRFLFD